MKFKRGDIVSCPGIGVKCGIVIVQNDHDEVCIRKSSVSTVMVDAKKYHVYHDLPEVEVIDV